jgi:hypothetical protein
MQQDMLQRQQVIFIVLTDRSPMNRLLPALAAYIGLVGVGSTELYLSMTSEGFRKQLVKLSPQRPKKRRWRHDPALMKFLAEL